MTVRLLDAGDAALTIEFGAAIDPRLVAAVNALDAAIARLHAAGGLPGLIEAMPTFRSLTLFYDPLVTGREAVMDALRPLLTGGEHDDDATGRSWRLPVCYEGEAAPDLAPAARAVGLGEDDVIALHSGTEYRVYMLGFLPGFAFMGDVPAPLRLPRRAEPRVRVPSGSVAIATGLTSVYPCESPGGWHLIGRCPLPLFDPRRASPSLLAPGDRVRFTPLATPEYRRLAEAAQRGDFNPAEWRADAAAEESA